MSADGNHPAAPAAADPLAQFKANQRTGWAHFAPLATFTTPTAAKLVRFASVEAGQRVLDVGTGTGVVAITAALRGAKVTGADLSPDLLAHAAENARTNAVAVDWREADVEQLPFDDAAFDVVLSQFGHMFAPRPDVAVAEMLRVLRPGGTIAFSTWPPDAFIGRMFVLTARYAPPPPPGVSPPALWGEPTIIRERLGDRVKDLTHDRGLMLMNALSPQHLRAMTEQNAGPVRKLVEMLSASDPAKLEAYRREHDAICAVYFEDNQVRQNYLMTRATKA